MTRTVTKAVESVLAHPVLGGAAHKALRGVLILLAAGVAAQLAVDVAQLHQQVRVVALHTPARQAPTGQPSPYTALVS